MHIPLFAHVAAVSFLIPTGFAIRYWKSNSAPMKIFGSFCFFSTVQVCLEFILGRKGISTQFFSHVYTLISVECLLYLYSKWIQKRSVRDILNIVGLIYFVFWFLDVSFFPFPKEFRENIDAAANIVIIISSVLLLAQMVKLSEHSLTNHSIYWIAIGEMLYSAGTIIVFSFSNTILSMGIEYFNMLWHINWGFTIIANLFFARSFKCKTF